MQSGLRGIAAPIGIGNFRYKPSGIRARSRTAEAKLRDAASVKDFGAVGKGRTDDTRAFAEAIAELNAGRFSILSIPEGVHSVDGTFPITKDGAAIIGAGMRLSRIAQQTARDTFVFQSTDPSTKLISDIVCKNFGIDYGDINAPLAGCALTLNRVQRGYFLDIDIRSVFQGIDIIGGHELFFESYSCHGAFSWTSPASQSFLMRTRKGAQNHVPSEIFVSNFNMKGFTSSGG